MKLITSSLCLLVLLSVACDDGSGPVDRTAELPETLLEQGWYIDDDGDLVREREDGTIEHALPEGDLASAQPEPQDAPVAHDAVDDLASPADPAAVTGTWTSVGTSSCLDLFTKPCSPSIPLNQCVEGASCEWYPGASCYEVISSASAKVLRCRL